MATLSSRRQSRGANEGGEIEVMLDRAKRLRQHFPPNHMRGARKRYVCVCVCLCVFRRCVWAAEFPLKLKTIIAWIKESTDERVVDTQFVHSSPLLTSRKTILVHFPNAPLLGETRPGRENRSSTRCNLVFRCYQFCCHQGEFCLPSGPPPISSLGQQALANTIPIVLFGNASRGCTRIGDIP